MLEAGGNAFDAALAAFCAACVSEPVLASCGGGGFLLARAADQAPVLYDFFPQTPRRRGDGDGLDFFPITADFGPVQQEFHIGRGAIAVPGAVRGLFAVHGELCRLPLAEIMAPAIELARRGVAVIPYQSYLLEVVAPIYRYRPEARVVFASREDPDRLLMSGEDLRNPDLADLFESLVREGVDLFYRGAVADRIVELGHDGGLLSADDLAAYRVARRVPLAQAYGDATVTINPPPSSGGILVLFALGLWARRQAASPRALVEIMAATNKARIDSGLDDDPARDEILGLLDPALVARYADAIADRPHSARGTTQISVIDGDGNAASLTVSNGEGCGYLIPGTGTMLNNMLGEDDINPRGFNNWRPDTRISSMMAPALVEVGRDRLAALGSGGSNRIRTAMFQVLRQLVAGEADLAGAVTAPRLHYEGGVLNVEPGFDPGAVGDLLADYPDHKLWDAPNMFFGGVHAVEFDAASRTFIAVGDARRGGAVAEV
ncbi:MAG: gamma-glutamyltransferase [Alphaproteobacteria bacterium]|nr:gamma-glutamyltransferase [Alphaproteobacteria bacterium]